MVPLRTRISILIIFSLVSLLLSSVAASTNVTIDDQNGDASTGAMPTYSPAGVWNQGASCSTCHFKLDLSKTYASTWHDSTLAPGNGSYTIEINFTGSAVYAFFVLANQAGSAVTFTNLTFSLDGDVVGSFVHYPTTSTDFQYNVTAYSNGSIPNTAHTLVITSVATTSSALALFDRVVYTSGDVSTFTTSSSSTSSKSTSSSTGPTPVNGIQSVTAGSAQVSSHTDSLLPPLSFTTASQASNPSAGGGQSSSSNSAKTSQNAIIGSSIGGGVAVLIISAIALLCVRRRRRRKAVYSDVTPFITKPADNSGHKPSDREQGVVSIRQRSADFLSLGSSRPDSLSVVPPTSDNGKIVAPRPVLSLPEKDPFRRDDEIGDRLSPPSAAPTHTPSDRIMSNPLQSNRKGKRLEIVRERTEEHQLLNEIATLRAEVHRLHDQRRQRGAGDVPPPGYHKHAEARAL